MLHNFGDILLVIVIPVAYLIGLTVGVVIGRYERKRGMPNRWR